MAKYFDINEEDCLQYFKKTQEKAELMKKNEILLDNGEKLSLGFWNERKYTFKKEFIKKIGQMLK